MNRLYIIKVGLLEVRGLISPGELPNLWSDFIWHARYYGAEFSFEGSMMIARKDGVEISLTIGACHVAIPGKQVLEALVDVMDEVF